MDQIGVLRTQWLSQIAEAIESAQKLAWQLRTQEGASTEARELYNRLESARAELESLSGSSICGPEITDTDWLRVLGWSSATKNDEP